MKNNGVLVLELKNGEAPREFPGVLFGSSCAPERAHTTDRGFGEVVFNTSMTGYQEVLTDPSYYGQIVVMTSPHIGNTGVNKKDFESRKSWVSGFVVHEACTASSNWRSEQEFESFLVEQGIPGISRVDTRAVTRFLRTSGAVRGVILPIERRHEAQDLLKKLPAFEGRDLIREVTVKTPFFWPQSNGANSKGPSPYVVALDFGVKFNLLNELANRGCRIEVLPASVTANEILERKPDGIFLSNGPGDPTAAPYAVETIRALIGKIPIFGVCMGHQILALACGAKVMKLKFGHRGSNQPVYDRGRDRVEISSHNHGYAVDGTTLPSDAEITHVNLNDKTVEGFRLRGKNAYSVQYHPEANPGPHDSYHLFDEFVKSLGHLGQTRNV